MHKVKALILLEDRLQRLTEVECELDNYLVAARDAGATLSELAGVLRVATPQAARYRLGQAKRRTDERNHA